MFFEYQTKGKQFKAELQKKESELIDEILLDIEKILKKIAQEEGYSVILNKPAILYMSADLDLTDTVIDTLNKASSE
jgi:outer membrane protein